MKTFCNYNIIINNVCFIWDPHKAFSNEGKHHITFWEAATVFADSYYIEISDPDHSDDEERFIALGFSESARLLVVCHCLLDDERTVRIISARKATAHEAKQYGEKTHEKRI
jgi:uncharacterized DUF497 family protein